MITHKKRRARHVSSGRSRAHTVVAKHPMDSFRARSLIYTYSAVGKPSLSVSVSLPLSLSHTSRLSLLPQVAVLILPLVVVEERAAEVHVRELRLRLKVDVLLVRPGVLFSYVVGE